MRKILFIGNEYCLTLERLQAYFTNLTPDSPLYEELMTLQRDGALAEWLEEGTEKEKELAKALRNLPCDITNKELMEGVGKIFTNVETSFSLDISSYLELKEANYAIGNSGYQTVETGTHITVPDESHREVLRLRITFKVLRPEVEKFNFKASLSLKGECVYGSESTLALENERAGTERALDISVPMSVTKNDAGSYQLNVCHEKQTILSINIYPQDPGEFVVNGVKFKMIKVQGGKFMMGATSEQGSEACSDEHPEHQVTLSDYWIGETPVTQKLWKAVMGDNPSHFKGDNRPVECVSWYECQEFISKLNSLTKKNFTLPTEAQWEFAARGGTKSGGHKYSGSDNIGDVAWYGRNSGSKTHDVGTKQANELGLYDMSGNVWEWCQDRYGSYSSSSQTDPTGPPDSFSDYVRRGGSWNYEASLCRVSNRDSKIGIGNRILGLRLVLRP